MDWIDEYSADDGDDQFLQLRYYAPFANSAKFNGADKANTY